MERWGVPTASSDQSPASKTAWGTWGCNSPPGHRECAISPCVTSLGYFSGSELHFLPEFPSGGDARSPHAWLVISPGPSSKWQGKYPLEYWKAGNYFSKINGYLKPGFRNSTTRLPSKFNDGQKRVWACAGPEILFLERKTGSRGRRKRKST